MKKMPVKVSFSDKKKRNVYLFEAGLHTQHLKIKDGEKDFEFVTRYLIQYLSGCRERSPDSVGFFLFHSDGDDHVSIANIVSKERQAEIEKEKSRYEYNVEEALKFIKENVENIEII